MSLITILQPAASYLKTLEEKDTILRLKLKNAGCVGYAYELERAPVPIAGDVKIEQQGVTLWLDAMAVLYLAGTTIDYRQNELETGLAFDNPNIKQTCGCGASFSF